MIRRLAFDLDGTLANYSKYWIETRRDYFGYNPVNPKAYELMDMYGLTQEEEDTAFDLFDNDYEINGEPFEGIVEVFNELEKMGKQYMIMSNRTPWRISAINGRNWVEKNIISKMDRCDHFIGYEFNTPHTIKGEVCKRKGVDLISEDAPYQILDCSIYVPVIMHCQPYNIGISGKNIYPVADYKDFIPVLKKIEEENA